MNNNKVVAVVLAAIGAPFALLFLLRVVMLSQYGVSGGWIYFGLPFGGIGVIVLLLRLGLLNFGERSGDTIQHWQYHSGVQAPPLGSPVSAASVSQRLQELDTMYANGAISDWEYAAKRQQLISGM